MTTLDEVRRYQVYENMGERGLECGLVGYRNSDPENLPSDTHFVLAADFDAAVAQHAVEFNALSKTAAEFCAERDRLKQALKAARPAIEIAAETLRDGDSWIDEQVAAKLRGLLEYL